MIGLIFQSDDLNIIFILFGKPANVVFSPLYQNGRKRPLVSICFKADLCLKSSQIF